MERRIGIEGRFDLRSTVRMVKAGGIDGRGVWWWSTATNDGPATMAATFADGSVDAETWGPGASLLLERLPVVLGVDDRTQLTVSPGPVKDLLLRHAGIRLGASGAVFEATVIAITGQLVTSTEAVRSRRRLLAAYGGAAPGPNAALRSFPEPHCIAELSYEDLHSVGIERKRASTLIEAARRAKRLYEILAMDRDAAWARLEAIRGIGPWTAALVMGIAYGDKDAVPTGDYHLPNTVSWALAGEPRGDDARMLELLEPYRPERRRLLLSIKAEGIRAPKYGPKTPIREHF